MLKHARIVALATLVSACAAAPSVSFSQQPLAETASPRFDISRFDITGATLVPAAKLSQAVAPYTGKGRDFGDIQHALETVEQIYRAGGWGVVQVLLPEQDITRGVVELRVLEPRIGRVVVEGNKFFDTDNIRNSVPSIKEGTTPNTREMSRNLQMLGEHPTKQTSITLRGGASEDQVDANIKVTDEKPWRVFFTLDNTGTSDTGYMRFGAGFQHSNLWNKDHSLTVQYIGSPTKWDKVSVFGAGYHIPIYDKNVSLDLIGGWSDVNSGTVQGLFNVAGSGLIGAARLNYYLPKWQDFEQKLALGWDYRAFSNNVTPAGGGGGIVPDITIHPLSLTYSALRRFSASEFSFYASYSKNIPMGNDGEESDFACPRPTDGLCVRAGADANYSISRFGGNYVQVLPMDFQIRAAMNAQVTPDALVPGELFGLGGPDSVRGYAVREIASDKGYQGQLEVYSPEVGRHFGAGDDSRLRFLGFYDFGSLGRNKLLPGEIDKEFISSRGLGLRFSRGKDLSVRVDVAQRLHATPTHQESYGIRTTGAIALVY